MKTQLKWVVPAAVLVFLASSIGMVAAQQGDPMQRQMPQHQPQMGQQDTGAGDQQIYDILKKEHNQVKDLLSKIGDSKDPRKTAQLMAQLKFALVPHMKAEEQVVYPELEKSAKTKSLALQAQKEHKAAEKILNDMSRVQGNDPQWQASFNMLNQSIKTHIQNEEGPLFSQAREILNDQQARQLARSYLSSKKQFASQPMAKAGL